jgi:hypothetical protein
MCTRAAALLLASATLAACGGGTGVDVQTFTVSLANTPVTSVREDSTIVSTISLVVDTDAGHVIGASLKYAVTAGDLSDTNAVSGVNGFAVVTWTVTPAQAAGRTKFTFSACADSGEPVATCTPYVLATLDLTAGS